MVAEYDVSMYHVRDDRVKRPNLYIYCALIVFFAAEALYLGVLPPRGVFSVPTDSLPFKIDVLIISVGMFFALILLISLPQFFSGASKIRVDERGVQLLYSNGRTDFFGWREPRDRFYIQDFSAYPREIDRGRWYYLILSTRSRPGRNRCTWLTPEAAKGIIDMGTRQGAEYKTWNGIAWFGLSPKIHWFRGTPAPRQARSRAH